MANPRFSNLSSRQCNIALRILIDLEKGPATASALLKNCALGPKSKKIINRLLYNELRHAGCLDMKLHAEVPVWSLAPSSDANIASVSADLHERITACNKKEVRQTEVAVGQGWMHVPEELDLTTDNKETDQTRTITRTPSPSPLQLSPRIVLKNDEKKRPVGDGDWVRYPPPHPDSIEGKARYKTPEEIALLKDLLTGDQPKKPAPIKKKHISQMTTAEVLQEMREAAQTLRDGLRLPEFKDCPGFTAMDHCEGRDFWTSAAEWVNNPKFLTESYERHRCDWCQFKELGEEQERNSTHSAIQELD